MPRWTVEVRDPDGGIISELPLARDIRFRKTLNSIGRADFTLDINDPAVRADVLHIARNEIFIRKGKRAFFAGKLLNYQLDGVSGRLRCLAYSWEWLLSLAVLEGGDSSVTTGYTSTDIGAVISGLINEHQAKTGGGFGLTEGIIQTSRDIDRQDYRALSNRLELIHNLTTIKDGVDFEIYPDKSWNVFYSRQGIQRDEIELSFPGNLTGFTYEVDGIDMATNFFVRGDGTDDAAIVADVEDATQIGVYGLFQDSRFYSSEVLTTLEQQGNALLDQRKLPRITIDSLSWVAGALGAPAIESFWLGDVVRLKIKRGQLLDVKKDFRIERIEVVIDENDAETITVGGAYA